MNVDFLSWSAESNHKTYSSAIISYLALNNNKLIYLSIYLSPLFVFIAFIFMCVCLCFWMCCCIAMNNYTYTCRMQNHNNYTYTYRQNQNDDTIKTQFFRKIPLLTLFERVRKGYKRFYCGRELETEQNCNILTPTLMAITAFLFYSSWAAQLGLLCQSLWDMFSFPHLLSNWSDLQLTDFMFLPGLYNCSPHTFFLWTSQIPLIQPVHGQGYILIFLDRIHLLFTQVHFLFWQRGRGQYITVCKHFNSTLRTIKVA